MDEVKTPDINLATYLSLVGFETVRLELDDEQNCTWVYNQSHEINQALIEYATGSAQVTPQEYSRAFGKVRRHMFNFIDGVTN